MKTKELKAVHDKDERYRVPEDCDFAESVPSGSKPVTTKQLINSRK